jgi:D-alanyl-D-alanine carboxypeptidase/D-alanyl-D-alanine-endopeptidase (penicillin-binding protein 4)
VIPDPGSARRQARPSIPAVRRWLLILAVVALVATAAGGAWEARRLDAGLDDPAAASAPTQPALAVRTPVLSARRAPRWLQIPTADASLASTLEQVAVSSPPDTCLVVSDGARTIYAHNADLPLVPASAAKIVTGVAALDLLGEEGRFRTTVVAATAPAQGVIDGDLWLVGGGDPVLATSDYIARYDEPQLFTDIAGLADAIVAAGVIEIRGGVVGDESRYDAVRAVASWDPVFVRDKESGPLSALSVNDGFSSYPRNRQNTTAVPAADPPAHAAGVLSELLRARGVKIGGGNRSGVAPSGAIEVAALQSAPIAEIVGQMLGASDNTTAELLTKELGVDSGAGGSTAAGVIAARGVLQDDGVVTDGVVLNDGSGLDRGDRLTCNALVAMLGDAGDESTLAGGLPIAGEKGTLRQRWVGTAASGLIRAKTGSVRNSRSLAGFADTAVGALTFAYIANAAPTIDGDANIVVQDRLGLELVAYPQGPSLDQLAPNPVSAAPPSPDDGGSTQSAESTGEDPEGG